MASIHIDNRSCDRSPGCPARRVCPFGAIVPVAGGPYPGANGYTVDDDRCAGCGDCVRVCAGGAVRLS
jgi:Fe-S-cluster-containing hydrogenase component 2